MSDKFTIVIDLDGTLANIEHRLHFLKCDKPDWDSFYDNCDKDIVNDWCKEISNNFYSSGYRINIVSARRDTEYSKTYDWLIKNKVKFSNLIMLRNGDDNTPDVELKLRWLKEQDKSKILFVIDDRQRVVDMCGKNGLDIIKRTIIDMTHNITFEFDDRNIFPVNLTKDEILTVIKFRNKKHKEIIKYLDRNLRMEKLFRKWGLR